MKKNRTEKWIEYLVSFFAIESSGSFMKNIFFSKTHTQNNNTDISIPLRKLIVVKAFIYGHSSL